MNIHENIKVLRLQKRLSQLDVADAIAVSQSAYAQLESGKTEITLNRIEQLAELFGMTVIELLQYNGEKVPQPQIVDNEKVKDLENKIKLLEHDLIRSYTYLHECLTFLRYFKETMLEHYRSVPNEDASLITLADLNKTWTKKVSFKFNDDDYQKHLLETPLKMAKIGDLFDACMVLHDNLNRYKRDLEKRYDTDNLTQVDET
jgi:transcriptional regulator with XRE-family HTH domain